MRAAGWILVVGFLSCLLLPSLDMKYHLSPHYPDVEKRTLAPLPSFAWRDRGALATDVDRYVRDHFGFRELLIRWHSLLQVKMFHRSSVPNVIIGQRGWLFYAGLDDGADIGDFQGLEPLTPAELEQRRLTLEQRSQAMHAHGIAYLFVVPPNKQSVYGEHLPPRIGPRRRAGNRLDQFTAVMNARSTSWLIDLRQALVPADSLLYYTTDTHWNEAGAFRGYRSILQAAHARVPAITPLSDDDFDVTWSDRRGGDLADMLALADAFADREVTYRRRPTARAPLPLGVVVVGDSFAERLMPFLQATFARVKLLSVADYGGFPVDAIVAEKPDLVIDERVERYLMSW